MRTAITDILHERRAIDMLKYERNSAKIGEFIHFLKHNVLNISEITRQNKLTEILNKFAGEKTEEVFIVQNSKNKEAQAAVVDVEYLMELIEYKNKFILAQDEEADEFVYKTDEDLKDIMDELKAANLVERIKTEEGTKTFLLPY